MFTDELRDKVWSEIRQRDLRAFNRLLPDEVFVAAAQYAGVRLGCSALSLVQMVWLGIAGAMHVTRNFAGILQLTLKLLEDSSDWRPKAVPKPRRKKQKRSKQRSTSKKRKPSKRNPRGKSPTSVTEEAFVQARKRMPLSYWAALLLILGQRFEKKHGAWVRWNLLQT